MRPGSPPPPPRRRRPLGPTPRYLQIPRWGLSDHIELDQAARGGVPNTRIPARVFEGVLLVAAVTLAIAGGAHLLRYLLMVINRAMLLPGLVAKASNGLVYLTVAVAALTVIAAAVCFADWLVARRAESYRAAGHEDPRPSWEIWLTTLLPIANLVYPQVYLTELAHIEARRYRLVKPIRRWWLLWGGTWLLALVVWICRDPHTVQGIADNAVFTALAYGVAAYAAWSLHRVYLGFSDPESLQHRTARWVPVERLEPARSAPPAVVEDKKPDDISAAPVEPVGAEPAALERERVAGAW